MTRAWPALARIFKAYDVRGLVESELSPDLAREIGAASAVILGVEGAPFVVGRDMRPSSPQLAAAFADGVTGAGFDVIDIGLASTDQLYFASGTLSAPGAMFTASHNPADYNGIKLCRAGAAPVAIDSGLAQIRDLVGRVTPARQPGRTIERDLGERFADHVRSFVEPRRLAGVRVAVDAANGMAGHIWPLVTGPLALVTTPMYFELDGTFPHHPANPLDPANLVDLARELEAGDHDLGLAFDGDADRVFALDERGRPISASVVGAIVAERMLQRHPGETVLHNLISSRIVAERIRAAGGRPEVTRVGHSFIKARMAATDAVMAVEHSGHYYYRDNFRADSGVITALLLIEALAGAGVAMSELVARYAKYHASGERNLEVDDVDALLERAARAFEGRGAPSWLDGLSVDLGEAWFNLRPSNTEPLVRLNAEAADRATVDTLVAELEAIAGS